MEEVIENEYFAQEFQTIQEKMIPTKKFGKVFALTAGNPGQPLIIVVHGSGPKNSSQQYRFLLHEYLVRISYLQKFYIVAIDCPGYGRSQTKSREAIKTFPLELFKQLLISLGYKNYFAMLGHSQGGSAIFHAVYQDPSITQFLVMDRPVCGNIQRFHQFSLPTLLIYDIQDDGHPIWQGKLLYKQLKTSQFYTYRTSQQPYWVPDNIWQKMLGFFSRMRFKQIRGNNFNQTRNRGWNQRFPSVQKQKKNKSEQKRPITGLKGSVPKRNVVSVDVKQQVKRQRKHSDTSDIQKRLESVQQVDHSQIYSMLDAAELKGKQFQINQKDSPKVQEFYFNKEQFKSQKIQQKSQKPKQKENIKIKIQTKQKQLKQLKQQGQDEFKCSICFQILFFPIQTNCHHLFCLKCISQSMLVDQRCPLCRSNITKKTKKDDLHEKLVKKMDAKQVVRRKEQYQKLQKMLKSIVYIQIGNTSTQLQMKKSAFTKTKKKYAWEVYVKKPKGFQLQQVLFNINMGNRDAKPVSVKNAPYAMQNKSTFSFSCQITIKPRNKDYDNLISIYRIDVEPGQHKKIVALRKKIYSKQ